MIRDQAENLRKFVQSTQEESVSNIKQTKVFCISSGKGGVGKSNFTVNLALELRNRGKKVIIFDADFGLANVEILLGVRSNRNFLDLLYDEVDIRDIITPMGNGVSLISGGSGILELANVDEGKLQKVVNSVSQLQNMADYILIDTGAGISNLVTSFAHIATEVMVVTTTEPTAVADAYALIKVIANKNRAKKINLVINKADSKKEADEIFKKMDVVSRKFANKEIDYLGYIYNDPKVSISVKKQKAFIELYATAKVSKCIYSICDKILEEKNDTDKFSDFIEKFRGLFR